jgi:SAM-dependent methyltransferase
VPAVLAVTADALATYEAHAAHYDLFVSHHDREAWTDTIEQLCVDAGLAGRRLLDVACGTGLSFLPFLARGYAVTGCDISPRMLEIAAEKTGGAVPLSVHDMRELPELGSFDLVCCLDDAINYLETEDDLRATFAGIRRNLAPAGIVVFDVNTLEMYRSFFTISTVVQRPGTVLVWTGRESPEFEPGGRAVAEHVALDRRPDDTWTRTVSVHRQRHFPRAAIERALESAGLPLLDVYGMQNDGTVARGYDELGAAKAIFLASGRGAAEVVVHEAHDHRALAHGGRAPLDRA